MLQSTPIYAANSGWYGLLERVTTGSLPPEEALSLALRGREEHSDGRWALPVAMIYWMDKRYSDALNLLLDDPVKRACESLWIYHNLVGMSARQIDGELKRATAAFEDRYSRP